MRQQSWMLLIVSLLVIAVFVSTQYVMHRALHFSHPTGPAEHKSIETLNEVGLNDVLELFHQHDGGGDGGDGAGAAMRHADTQAVGAKKRRAAVDRVRQRVDAAAVNTAVAAKTPSLPATADVGDGRRLADGVAAVKPPPAVKPAAVPAVEPPSPAVKAEPPSPAVEAGAATKPSAPAPPLSSAAVAAAAGSTPAEGQYLADGSLDLSKYTQIDARDPKWKPRLDNKCERWDMKPLGVGDRACRDDEQLLMSGDLAYEPFFLPMPLFYDDDDARFWRECSDYGSTIIRKSKRCPAGVCGPAGDIDHDKYVAFWTERHLVGRINVVANATYRRRHVCGWHTGYQGETEIKENRDGVFFKKAINLLAPQSWSFQHFINDVFPKIIQFWPLLTSDPDVKMVIERGRDQKMVNRILKFMGFDMGRFHDYHHADLVRADAFWFGCNAPPIHPWLWQGMREVFRVKRVPFEHRKNIVILSRAEGAANGGRKVLNEPAMIAAIKRLCEERGKGEKVIVFKHKNYPEMQDYVNFFNSAKALIGPHGGAFDNLIFTPRDTLVMEFQPIFRSQRRSCFPNAMMFYQTGMLDQRYYRLFEDNNGPCNMNVRIPKVIEVLKKELDGNTPVRALLKSEAAAKK